MTINDQHTPEELLHICAEAIKCVDSGEVTPKAVVMGKTVKAGHVRSLARAYLALLDATASRSHSRPPPQST